MIYTKYLYVYFFFFFFQAEDGIRDTSVTGVQTCALPIFSLIGLLISVFIGVGLVSKEMDKRTLYALLAKPVRRWEFLLGKFGGLVLTLAVNTAAMGLGLFLDRKSVV